MYKYAIWARINNLQTTNTFIYADNDYVAKQIAESMFGYGNVLNYSRVN
jgi:hypothetical protein